MKELTTSSLRLFAIGTLIALPLTGCDNEAGQARNDAERQLEETAKKIQTHALGEAYPTPMTEEQTTSLGAWATEVPGGKPDWMTDEQAQRMSSLNASNFRPLDTAKSELEAIQSSLSAGSGDKSLSEQQAAKAALRTEAALGLARLRLEEANRSDARLQQEISLASAHIDAVLELQSIIAANAGYDPSSPLRQIDSQAQDARARLSKHQADAREIQTRINDLQTRIDAEVRETNRLGEQAARDREAALASPLEERIAKIEAAAAVARRADGHQVTAAQLESQVDVLQPDLVRAQMFVLEAEGELKDLDAARARIKAREQQVAAEGTRLQADLRAAIEEFGTVYASLATRFESELMPRYDSAREAAESALRDARGSRVTKAQQTLGQSLWRQSMSIESFAQLVRRMATNGSALGRTGQDGAAADALDGRAQEARDAAEAALREALGSIPESGRSEEETANNQRLATMIRESIEYITGQAVAEVRDLTDLAESVPVMDEPIMDSGESPLGLLQKTLAITQSGRLAEIPSLFLARTPGQQTALDAMKRSSAALARIDAASRQQFGVGFIEITEDPRFATELARLGGSGIGGQIPLDRRSLSGLPDLSSFDLESIEFMYDNARTTSWTDDIPELAGQNFVHENGQWYFEAPEIPEEAQAFMSMVLDPMIQTMENIADRTNNGEFVDQWLMVSSLLEELGSAIQKAMGNMMPEGFDPGGVGRQRNRDGGGG